MLQTVLPPLLMAEGPLARSCSRAARTTRWRRRSTSSRGRSCRCLRAWARASRPTLERPGFYPAGGGRFVVDVTGGAPLDRLLAARARRDRAASRIRAVVSQIPDHVAARELKVLAAQLADLPLALESARVDSAGPGNVVTVDVHAAHVTEIFTGFGEVGVRAEKVAHRVAGEVREYLAADAPVGEHLADQLLIPLALAGSGEFRTTSPSLHTRTNLAVIERFRPGAIVLDESDVRAVRVSAMR